MGLTLRTTHEYMNDGFTHSALHKHFHLVVSKTLYFTTKNNVNTLHVSITSIK